MGPSVSKDHHIWGLYVKPSSGCSVTRSELGVGASGQVGRAPGSRTRRTPSPGPRRTRRAQQHARPARWSPSGASCVRRRSPTSSTGRRRRSSATAAPSWRCAGPRVPPLGRAPLPRGHPATPAARHGCRWSWRGRDRQIFVILAEFGNQRHPDPDQDTDPSTPGPAVFDGPLTTRPRPTGRSTTQPSGRRSFTDRFAAVLRTAPGMD